MPCPKCSADVPIPGRKPRARAPEPPPVVFRKQPRRRKQEPTTPGLIDALGSLRVEQFEGAPPRWPLVWGVFTFPWHPDVLLRWLFLSAGYATIGLLAAGVVWCVIVGGPMLRAAYAFLFPLFWISIWTASYTAACALVVIEQTANGTQEIGEWPEPQWTGWLLETVQILLPGLVAVLAAWGTGVVFRATTGAFWIPFGAAFAFCKETSFVHYLVSLPLVLVYSARRFGPVGPWPVASRLLFLLPLAPKALASWSAGSEHTKAMLEF